MDAAALAAAAAVSLSFELVVEKDRGSWAAARRVSVGRATGRFDWQIVEKDDREQGDATTVRRAAMTGAGQRRAMFLRGAAIAVAGGVGRSRARTGCSYTIEITTAQRRAGNSLSTDAGRSQWMAVGKESCRRCDGAWRFHLSRSTGALDFPRSCYKRRPIALRGFSASPTAKDRGRCAVPSFFSGRVPTLFKRAAVTRFRRRHLPVQLN